MQNYQDDVPPGFERVTDDVPPGFERVDGPRATPPKKVKRSIHEIAQDESIPKAQRDILILERMGWDPSNVTNSKDYVPGELADRASKKTDYSYSLGQTRGGTLLKGLIEGVAGPIRTLGVGAAHLKEAAGIGKTPSSDRRRAEALANIDKMNYDYETTDEATGKGNFGQVLGPIAGELVAGNKAGGVLKTIKGLAKIAKVARNPVVQGSLMGALQPSVIEGDKEGGSNFGAQTFKKGALGGVTAGVVAPAVGKGLDAASKTKIGEYLQLKMAEGPITLEKLKALVEAKLGGKTPGEVAKAAQTSAASAKNKELSELFNKTGRRAKPGEVDTSGIVEVIGKHKRALGREWNVDDPVENYLSELERSVAQKPVPVGRTNTDAITGDRSFFKQAEIKGNSEAGTTFPDLMREYKIAGAKMRQAYAKGGQDSAAGATSGLRGGLQHDLKTAIEDAARKHDPAAAAEWARAREKWQAEYKPFREGSSGQLLDQDNITPNKVLNSLVDDTSGDDIRNLVRTPLPSGTRDALEARKLEELKNVYDSSVARPLSPDTAGGGPSGLASAIDDPTHAAFVQNINDPSFSSALEEIAKRARTASKIGSSINVGGGSLVGAFSGDAAAGGGGGLVGAGVGAWAGSRVPNYLSRPIMRAMENPHLRRVLGAKYGLPEGSPLIQKIIDSMFTQGSALGASRDDSSYEQPENQ